jgi:hypothetical protein
MKQCLKCKDRKGEICGYSDLPITLYSSCPKKVFNKIEG